MKRQTLEITIPVGKRAEWINNVLTLVDEPKTDNRPVTERVKTFEDALNELGEEHTFVKEWRSLNGDCSKDIVAYLKLRIIAAALNEGWKPEFTDDEIRWYPKFTLWTEEELRDKSEEWKKEHSLWMFDGSLYYGSYWGVAFSYSNNGWSSSYSNVSARLGVKSEELSCYFGRQFIDIWADYVVLDNQCHG